MNAACGLCSQNFMSDKRAGTPLDVELLDKRAAKRSNVCRDDASRN